MTTMDKTRIAALVLALTFGSYLYGTTANNQAKTACAQANVTLVLNDLPSVDC